ncbi:MAG: hypothetical protein DMG68_18425 [Acidobacteria bacterium]|nr:MAG: hypothetical protein DMG68_18425 [Acidobacteriota bacterium]
MEDWRVGEGGWVDVSSRGEAASRCRWNGCEDATDISRERNLGREAYASCYPIEEDTFPCTDWTYIMQGCYPDNIRPAWHVVPAQSLTI